MRSAYAEAIEVFLAGGGKITHCPEGNALMPKEKIKHKAVGQSAHDSKQFQRLTAAVVAALSAAPAPLTLLGLEKATSVPHHRLRRALTRLEAAGQVATSELTRDGVGARGRTIFYRLAVANQNQNSEAA